MSNLNFFFLAEKERGEATTPPVATTAATTTPKTPQCKGEIWCDVRLPKAIVPNHYNLELTSYVEELKYNGTQQIMLTVSKPIDVVLVHIKDILIDSVSLKNAGKYYCIINML